MVCLLTFSRSRFSPILTTACVGCAKAEAAVAKARATPNTVIISVQLRNGDSGLEFECAGKLEAEYKAKGISVQYILMNSNSDIQAHYKQKYGDRIILPSWAPQTITDFHHGTYFIALSGLSSLSYY